MKSNRLGFINPRLTLVHKKCHLVLVISIDFHIFYYLSKVGDGKPGVFTWFHEEHLIHFSGDVR